MFALLLSKKGLWRRALLLLAVGAGASGLLLTTKAGTNASYTADLLFIIGSVFLVAGIWGVMKNLGTFNSTKYGTKSLLNMLRGRRETPNDKMMGGYLEYVQAAPKDKDALWLLLFAFAFLFLSVVISFPLF